MTQINDFTVESIIKKYQQRQELLTQNGKDYKLDAIDTDKNKVCAEIYSKSGSSTPEFSNTTNRKEKKDLYDNFIEKTHKKNQFYETFHPQQSPSTHFNGSDFQKREYERLLSKLDQTEEKLTRSERNYAEMWRKYQKMLKDSQKGGKQVEIENRLKQKEVQQLQLRLESYEKEVKNLKQCLNAKEGNISALRDKLNEKNLRMVETQRAFETLKSEFQMVKAKQQRIVQEQDKKINEKNKIIAHLKGQLSKFDGVLQQKESEKKGLLMQIEKNYIDHKQQLEILRMSYSKVQEEYKEWIQSCNQQKLNLIQTYEAKLRQNTKNSSNNQFKSNSIQLLEHEAIQKSQQISHLMAKNMKLSNDLKEAKVQLQNVQKAKLQLISKLSSLQNGMIQKLQYNKSIETSYSKLQNLYKAQQEKNKELSLKYNLLNKEFQQLKGKCSVLFNEMQQKKQLKNTEALEIIRLKKEIMICRQQLEKTKNNQMYLNSKINQSLATLKSKTTKYEQEKEDIMTDLLAERLENAKLKQELRQTKQIVQKEYQLSVQNMKRELQNQIKSNIPRSTATAGCDAQKQHLYLQLRSLEKRYQMLASEVVTVDEMIGLANKVQRRHQPRK